MGERGYEGRKGDRVSETNGKVKHILNYIQFQGDKGNKGDSGPMGLPGPMGYRGESGPVGPVGRQGIPVSDQFQSW